MRKKAITFTFVILVIAMVMLGFKTIDKIDMLSKPLINDDYNYIAINQVLMYVSNNGDGSHDPVTDGNGFYWPGGINAQKAAIFEDGLIWGTKIGRETRVNGNTHFQGLQAGKILPGGIGDDPGLPRYRVFKVRKGWEMLPPGSERDDFEQDHNEWPVEDGAPWVDEDGDGVYDPAVDHPQYIGDEVLWYVANDMSESRAASTYGTTSIGLEFQTTVFGFNRTGDFGDIVFKKYLIINKGTNVCKEMVLGYWSDPDLGDANDDFVGCDTILSLGYCYNGDNEDGTGAGIQYGLNPPAVGYDFFQGPIVPSPGDTAKFFGGTRPGYRNLGLTAFTAYINPLASLRDPLAQQAQGSVEFYRYLTGFVWNGNPFINPHTNQQTTFVVPGDPVAGVGWYEGPGWPGGEDPADRRLLMASGPITLAPGDSQEVVVGFVIAQGTDNLNSVTELKRKDAAAQIAYDLDFNLTPSPEAPSTTVAEGDRQIVLYWESNSESYNERDPILVPGETWIDPREGREYTITEDSLNYVFEGYRIWQYRDLAGTDPILLATVDLANGTTTVWGWETINDEFVWVPQVQSPDEGLYYFQTIINDRYNNKRLRNGSPYYFAVTAYGYSRFSTPQFLESPPRIIEVFPGTRKIDVTYDYLSGDLIEAEQLQGSGDGIIGLTVVDPNALTGDEYRVTFQQKDSLTYSFVNHTTGDTVATDLGRLVIDTVNAPIYDGFMLQVVDLFKRALEDPLNAGKNSFVKNVLETKGPGGSSIEPPVDVFENFNSSGDWEVTSYWDEPLMQQINVADGAGVNSYEIRFTSGGSQYYLSGAVRSFTPWRGDDPLAADRVPFEVWDVGFSDSPDDDVRLTIKTLDEFSSNLEDSVLIETDGTWTHLDNGNWEPFYAYFADSVYSEPLPATSGRLSPASLFKVGKIIISGDLPAEGTVIRVNTIKPLSEADVYSVVAVEANTEDFAMASESLDKISVFPNPYFGANAIERDKYQRFVRFTNLPTRVTVRIFTLAGVYIARLDKNDDSQWLDWDLRNRDGLPVASGVYIAHLEMPNIGEKIMKIAVIMETQFIDRL